MKQIKIEVPNFLHKKVKETALVKEVTMKQFVTQALIAILIKEKMIE